MIRAALYARTSPTEEREYKYGLDSQITELRELAAAKGYAIQESGIYLDEDQSGKVLDRPAMNKLREAACTKAFEVILCHDPDRLARKLALQLVLLAELEKYVRVEFKTTPREDSPEGRLLLNQKGVFAEYEREKIRERTLRGKQEKARRGLIPAGPVPYGYRMDPAKPGSLLIHEEQASVVRQIFAWLVNDQRSVRAITAELRRLGVRPARGTRMARTSVRWILTAPAYVGRAHFGSIAIPVPAIIDEGVFEQAQAQLRRNVALHAGRPPSRFYLLRGLLRCGLCGRRYSSNIANGKRQYRCTGQDKMRSAERCKAKPLAADFVERETWSTVVSMLKRPELMLQKMEAHRVTLGARDVEVKSEAEHLAKQLAEVERQEQKALDLYFVADDLTVDVVNVRLGEIQKRKAGLAERLTAARERIARHEAEEARQDSIRQACQQALRGIDRLDEEGRRRLLVTLVDRVVVGTDHTFEMYGFIPTLPALTPAAWSARSLDEAENGQSPWMIWPPLSSKLL